MDPIENLERRVKFQVGFFKSGLIATLVIYAAIGLVLVGLGLAVWWKMRSSGALDKLAEARKVVAGETVKKQVTWDGKTPFSCTGSDQIVLENITATAGVTANGSCHLTLRGLRIVAAIPVTAGGSSVVVVEGGALTGSDAAISANGAAVVTVKGAQVSGPVKRLGAAKVEGL